MRAVIVTVRGIRPQETKSRGLRTDMTDKWWCYLTDRHVTCHTSVTTASADQSWLTTWYLFHWFAGRLRRRLVRNSCLQSCRADQTAPVLMGWVSACNMLGPYTHTAPYNHMHQSKHYKTFHFPLFASPVFEMTWYIAHAGQGLNSHHFPFRMSHAFRWKSCIYSYTCEYQWTS